MKTMSIISSRAIVAILIVILLTIGNGSAEDSRQTYNDPYVGSMHPHIVSEGPGVCTECGMGLSRLEGHNPGTVLPQLSNIYSSPDSPMWVHEGPGKDPNTGNDLIQITESRFYQAPASKQDTEAIEMLSSDQDAGGGSGSLYTCGMHPDVLQEEPGICPLCGMDLTPISRPGSRSGGERKVAYWVAPMDPNYVSETPGKSPMGMDLVPVYEDEVDETIVWIDPATIQNIGVTTTQVESRDLSVNLRTNGIVTIAEDNEYRINPKISGWIEKLYANRTGDRVRKGDPLLEIYSPQLVAAQEEFLVALSNVVMFSHSYNERIKLSAENLVNSARRRLELWDISSVQIDELERSRKVSRTLTVYSPASGVVMHKNAVEGASVKAGMDLFNIVDLSEVWIEAQIFENELPWVSLGGSVEILSPYDSNLSLTGKVDYIYPYLDAKTRTVKLRITVANTSLNLRPEMYVDVNIQGLTRISAVAVPKSVVMHGGKRNIVFLALGEGRFIPREVQLGVETDNYYEITAGLSAGNRVVTAAQFLLDSEAKLQEAIQQRLKKMQLKKNS